MSSIAMIAQYDVDLGGRVSAFVDAYGVAGVGLVVIVAVAIIAVQFVKGPGLSMLLLVCSYSLVFVDVNAINIAAFFMRTLALFMLILSLVRRFAVPGWAFYGMFLYALIGLVCAARAPRVYWSMQNGGLLLVTTVALTIGLAGYLQSLKQVDALFRMFVVAGVIWCLASLSLAMDFIGGSDLRFGGGTSVHATNYAASGALLFPFMLWAAIQKGRWPWRLVGIGGMAVMLFCLFLSGTRTGFVVAGLASAPLLLRRGGGHNFRVWGLVGIVGIALVFGGARLLQGRSTDFLVNRLTSVTLGGREALWSTAFEVLMESPLVGRGIGSHNTLATEVGISEFHNAYLSIWCNAGAIGLLLVLSVLGYYTLHAFLLIRRVVNPLGQDALRLALGFLLAIAARGVVENSFASASNASIATLLIALTLVSTLRGFVLAEMASSTVARPQPVSPSPHPIPA